MTGDENPTGGRGGGLPDGRYAGVVDRFETTESDRELAVLLLESGDDVVAERAIPRWRLPEDAHRQDAVLELTLQNGYVVSMSHDAAETERRTSEARSRFDRLAVRPDEESESDGGDGGT
jgi:hypothetical protein